MLEKISRSVMQASFLSALGVVAYCSLVATIMWNSRRWDDSSLGFMAPLMALLMLSTSAMVCALLTLGVPVYLMWQKKETVKALKVAGMTAVWLLVITAMVLVGVIIF